MRAVCTVAALPIEPPTHDECPFCEGLAGRHDWALVDDQTDSLAFISPRPLRSGHILVIATRAEKRACDKRPNE